MESIPIDLLLEIFLRLPSKSIERFRCLSKLWRSLLHCPYFTELFLTMSLARPRLLFAIEQYEECCFFSSPQLQNPYEKSSLVVAPDFHTKFPGFTCTYDSGLIFVSDRIGHYFAPMICNPNTGQYLKLPRQSCRRSSYIGFDPIDKQFKVLSMTNRFGDESFENADHKILTLGTGKLRWRKIQCPLSHGYSFGNICLNGVLYYLAEQNRTYYTIVCFDIRSEKFKFIEGDYRECFPDFYSQLVNYNGKLGLVAWWFDDDEENVNELRLWVLEDLEKQVWSKYVYTLPKFEVCDPRYVDVAGVTAMGQIVLSMQYISKKPFYVFYFNPQDKALHTVEIQGFEGFDSWAEVRTYVEHVEDLKVSDAKLFRSREKKQRETCGGEFKR